MKKINLTLDNCFRNPFRWGRCPISIYNIKVFGIIIVYGEMMPTTLINRWYIVLYYGSKYKAWSNYPIQ